MNIESNIENFCESIFNSSPKEKKSIYLELEESCKNEESIFEIMLIIANYGMRYLFNIENPLYMKKEQFELLNKYFNSFGMKIKFSAESCDDINFLIERPDQLNDLLNEGYRFSSYKIYFEFI